MTTEKGNPTVCTEEEGEGQRQLCCGLEYVNPPAATEDDEYVPNGTVSEDGHLYVPNGTVSEDGHSTNTPNQQLRHRFLSEENNTGPVSFTNEPFEVDLYGDFEPCGNTPIRERRRGEGDGCERGGDSCKGGGHYSGM
jgi:hypothetical protein